MRGCLIGPENLGLHARSFRHVLDSPRTVCVACVIIYVINYDLGVVGLEMAMDFGSIKWNRCLVRALPRTTYCTDVGLLKTVTLCLLDRKWSMCVVRKILLKMNGLECVWKEVVNA